MVDQPHMAARPDPPDSPPRIPVLLVDDQEPNLVALSALLAEPRYRLVAAHSGEEALRHVRAETFAVIVLDVMMPGMDGFECARRIRMLREGAAVPIIFLTAVAFDPGMVLRGYEIGAVDYLTKPVAPAVVRAKISFFATMYKVDRDLRLEIEAMSQACHSLEAKANEERWTSSAPLDELREFMRRCERRVAKLGRVTSLTTAELTHIGEITHQLLGPLH